MHISCCEQNSSLHLLIEVHTIRLSAADWLNQRCVFRFDSSLKRYTVPHSGSGDSQQFDICLCCAEGGTDHSLDP